MRDDIIGAKITTKPRLENANFKFYQEIIPKAANMKRMPTCKQLEGNESLKKMSGKQGLHGGEFWAGYVTTHKIWWLQKLDECSLARAGKFFCKCSHARIFVKIPCRVV